MPSNAARISSSAAGLEPRPQDRGDQVARAEAAVLGGDVVAGDALEALERLGGPGHLDQRGPLAAGERDDHHAAAVAGAEVVAERAVEVVAVARRVLAADLDLGDAPEVADHREGDVGEREPDQLALAGPRALALGGQDPRRGEAAHDRVPRRQHGVERAGEVARAGRPREAGGRVDGVVDLRRAVRVARQRAHDQVGAALAQRVVGEPAAGGEVRQQDAAAGPGRAHQRRDELAPLGRAQVDLDRPLALVQPRPEQRPARRRERPAVEVDAAADLVEADDVGAELGERHAAERRGDERRALDHPQVGERLARRSCEHRHEAPVEHLGVLAAVGAGGGDARAQVQRARRRPAAARGARARSASAACRPRTPAPCGRRRASRGSSRATAARGSPARRPARSRGRRRRAGGRRRSSPRRGGPSRR